jgi:hypothetical protein
MGVSLVQGLIRHSQVTRSIQDRVRIEQAATRGERAMYEPLAQSKRRAPAQSSQLNSGHTDARTGEWAGPD